MKHKRNMDLFLPLAGVVSFMFAHQLAMFWVEYLKDTVLIPRLDLIIVLLGTLGLSLVYRKKDSYHSFVIASIISYLGVMMVGILALRIITYDSLTSNHQMLIVIIACGLYGAMFGYQHNSNEGAFFGGLLFVSLALIVTVVSRMLGMIIILQDLRFYTLLGGSLGTYLYLYPIYTRKSQFNR